MPEENVLAVESHTPETYDATPVEVSVAPAEASVAPVDPFGGVTYAPKTIDVPHDSAAYDALKNEVNAKAIKAIDDALDAVKQEFYALKVEAGHEATSMVRATLSYVLNTLKAEAAHVRRVIVP